MRFRRRQGESQRGRQRFRIFMDEQDERDSQNQDSRDYGIFKIVVSPAPHIVFPAHRTVFPDHHTVFPAKAGIQNPH